MKKRIKNKLRIVYRFIFLFLGAGCASAGLELFLIPNNIIDGGILGISIMSSYLTKYPLGLFIFFLNVPFLVIGYNNIGKTFVINTLFAVTVLSVGVSILHPIPGITSDVLLAAIFGGIILGIGVGMIIRYGGSLDGTEILAIIFAKRSAFSIGEIVMFFNIFILLSAGFVFGWDRAMYSLITYFVAYKVIDMTVEGLDESKAVMVISDKSDEIAELLMARLGRGITFLDGKGGYSKEPKNVMYSVITRLEIAKFKAIIEEIDENAFVSIHDVHDVMGGRLQKKAIH